MKKYLSMCLLVALMTVAGYRIGFETPAVGMTADAPATQPTTQPVNKMCAVEAEDAVDPAITTVYKGQVIGFCCKGCIGKFNADPEKYMKTLK